MSEEKKYYVKIFDEDGYGAIDSEFDQVQEALDRANELNSMMKFYHVAVYERKLEPKP